MKKSECSNSMPNCHGSCPYGWFNKKIFGVTLGVWLIAFAVLPHSAKGVSWTAKSVSQLWWSTAKAIGMETENKNRGQRKVRGAAGGRPDFIDRGDRPDGSWQF
tara:strand:+ start:158 stop:469 length:312 start_codon:yes stop_codon:yes gene_type:complete